MNHFLKKKMMTFILIGINYLLRYTPLYGHFIQEYVNYIAIYIYGQICFYKIHIYILLTFSST